MRKPSKQRTRENVCTNTKYAHLRACTQPALLFAAKAGLQPTPSPLCELALCLCIWGVIFDLT